jgi:type III pantothenate kinase
MNAARGKTSLRAETWLTVDLGNSRCKACIWEEAPALRVVESAAFEAQAGLCAVLAQWLAGRGSPRAIFLSSVGSLALEAELVDCLASAGRLLDPPECGLENRCENPHAVGFDRLFAARGAHAILASAAVVVDAGTALTVDALQVEEGRPVFLGGAIAPGPRLLALALGSGTTNLPEVEARPTLAGLGRSTREAIQIGIARGFAGAALELVESVGRQAGISESPVVLTGGALPFLRERLASRGPVRVVEHLTHAGLVVAGREALGLAAPTPPWNPP